MNREAFDALLARAQLPVSGEEYDRLLRLSEIVDRHRAALHLPEARNAEPDMSFRARGSS